MSLRPISASLLAIFLTTLFLYRLNAQTLTSGGVTGVITDQSLAVLPNADVEIRDINKGTTESTKTDRDGVYRFFFLSPSQYALTVEHDRFRKESRDVTVLLGTPVTVNVTLEIAKAKTQLSVTAKAPLIQADNGDVSITSSSSRALRAMRRNPCWLASSFSFSSRCRLAPLEERSSNRPRSSRASNSNWAGGPPFGFVEITTKRVSRFCDFCKGGYHERA